MVMGNSKNSRVFNFAILLKTRKSQKLDALEIYRFYSNCVPGFILNSSDICGFNDTSESTVIKLCAVVGASNLVTLLPDQLHC